MDDLSEYWDFPNKFETNHCYVEEVDLKDVGLAEYEDVFPVRSDIKSFLQENGKEIYGKSFAFYPTFSKIFGVISIYNGALFAALMI